MGSKRGHSIVGAREGLRCDTAGGDSDTKYCERHCGIQARTLTLRRRGPWTAEVWLEETPTPKPSY